MLKNLVIIASLSASLFAVSASEFKQQQMQGFKQEKKEFKIYKQTQENAFASYQKAQEKTYNEYKKELGHFWEKPKMSTKKSWVAYTKDKKTRTDVDFSKKTITVETIATSLEDAKNKLKLALAKVVTVDNKTIQQTDPLEKRLQKIKKPAGVVTAKVKADPILSTVIFDKVPTKKSVKAYVKKHIVYDKIKAKKSKKVKHAKIYSIKVQMPSNAMYKRSLVYANEVKKQSIRQNLPVSLVFAVMHTESSFNPRARSHIPAYGLMQIVPKTAGIDTYRFLYKKKRLVSGSYLYNSTNNITMGTAYLHILYYRYLKHIKNPDSRLYCTIAAYNTGAGNIAWAFTKTHNVKKAAPLINKLTPQEVYNKLLKDLRYDEPKHYLKRVTKRMSAYHKLYSKK